MLSKLQRLANRARVDDSDGFTLIELLIVVVIIGILAAIAIPQFSSTKQQAYDASAKSDLRNMQTEQEAYFATNQEYWGGSVSASADGGTATMGSNTFRASANVALTAQSATNGYTVQASHADSENCFEVETVPGGNNTIHSCN